MARRKKHKYDPMIEPYVAKYVAKRLSLDKDNVTPFNVEVMVKLLEKHRKPSQWAMTNGNPNDKPFEKMSFDEIVAVLEEAVVDELNDAWPAAYSEWNKSRTALVSAHTLKGSRNAFVNTGPVGSGSYAIESGGRTGKVYGVRIEDRNRGQIFLHSKELLEEAQRGGDIGALLSLQLGPFVHRFFTACMIAAHEDSTSGATDNKREFYYGTARFARLLGMPFHRKGRGKGRSPSKPHRELLNKTLSSLEAIGIYFTATLGRGKDAKPERFGDDSLLHGGLGTRGRMRRMAISAEFERLFQRWMVWLPYSFVCTPEGVGQADWDLVCLLGSHALVRGRAEENKTNGSRSSRNWLSLDSTAASIFPGHPLRKAREKTRAILPLLNEHTPIRAWITGRGKNARLCFKNKAAPGNRLMGTYPGSNLVQMGTNPGSNGSSDDPEIPLLLS